MKIAEGRVIEAARVYIAHWSGHDQGDDWLNRRNALAFKLGEAVSRLDAKRIWAAGQGVDTEPTPRLPPIPDLSDREARNAWLRQIRDMPGGTAPVEMVFYLAGLFAGIVSHLDKARSAFDALRRAKEADDGLAASQALEGLVVAVSHIPKLPTPSGDPGSPVVRNLDQMFLRVTRKGKARTLCLTDCTWAEVEDWLQAQPLDPVSELAAVAQHLHERLRAVGDGLDLASGAFPEIPE